jgi:hypothetical protein
MKFILGKKLGMSTIEIAGRLKIGQPSVSRSSKRGEKTARENQFELMPENRIKA